MIRLEHTVLPSPEQMEFVIEGMRNPMNSWDKSDSGYQCVCCSNEICKAECTGDDLCPRNGKYRLGDKDYLALTAEALDTSLEDIAIKNNKKLWERYPDGFKAENSLHRKEGDI